MTNPNIDTVSIDLVYNEHFVVDNEACRKNVQFSLKQDDAGDLRTVLAKMTAFLQEAGFPYVAALGAELYDGSMMFSDEGGTSYDGDIEDIITNINPTPTPFMAMIGGNQKD